MKISQVQYERIADCFPVHRGNVARTTSISIGVGIILGIISTRLGVISISLILIRTILQDSKICLLRRILSPRSR